MSQHDPLHIPDWLAESRHVALEIGDGYIHWDNGRGQENTLEGPYVFALAGQPDRAGSSNYTIHAAFNRVIAGSSRTGSGAARVQITLSTRPGIPVPEPIATPASASGNPN